MFKKLRARINASRKSLLLHAALMTAALGILAVSIKPLADLSYVLSFRLKTKTPVADLALVYVNQESLHLGAEGDKLNRTNYARLLDVLTQHRVRLAFIDAVFDEPSLTPGADEMLAVAFHEFRKHGPVIVVAGFEDEKVPGVYLKATSSPPISLLAQASSGWGHAEVSRNIVRKIPIDHGFYSYAGWIAATNLSPRLLLQNPDDNRWLNYYGAPDTGAIPTRTVQDALSGNLPPGFFENKIVLVGQNFPYSGIGRLKETFDTPYSLFGAEAAPGVFIHATALLNLTRGDWLRRVPLFSQWLAAILWAFAIVGFLYALSRKPKAVMVTAGLLGAVALCAISLAVQWNLHWWWSWIGPAFAQTPLALALMMRNPKPDRYIAFISYRTEEDGAAALLIARSLADRALKTFIDVRSLGAGKFDEQLLDEIESATFFILVLSPNSLARCVKEDDWLLRELTHALKSGKKVVPILKGGFSFDAKHGIPDLPQVSELKNYHGIVYSNSDFDGFMEKLTKLLKIS